MTADILLAKRFKLLFLYAYRCIEHADGVYSWLVRMNGDNINMNHADSLTELDSYTVR